MDCELVCCTKSYLKYDSKAWPHTVNGKRLSIVRCKGLGGGNNHILATDESHCGPNILPDIFLLCPELLAMLTLHGNDDTQYMAAQTPYNG